MTRKTSLFRLLCTLTLIFSWSVLSAETSESMVDESAQPAEVNEADSVDQYQEPQEDQAEAAPASVCSADLRSDSPADQIRGAQCAAENKDEKAVPDLIHLLRNQDNRSVLAEVLIALAAVGQTGDTTSALMERAADNSLKPADRYILVATLVALRTEEDADRIYSLLSEVEASEDSDLLLRDLATRLKPLVGG